MTALLAELLGLDDTAGWSWRDQALCAETDPEAFFPEKGGSVREARAVCERCPVAAQCLAFALEHREDGIWAGTTPKQRERLRRFGRGGVAA